MFLKLPNLQMPIKKKKGTSLSRHLTFGTFGKLLIVFSTKSPVSPLFNSQEALILMTHLSLYLFSLLVLISNWLIFLKPKMVKKVIMNLDSSKASGPDCVPVVVLKNCEPELPYISAELFSMCLKEYFFQIVAMYHWWSLYLRMLGKGLQLKTTALLVFFLWLVRSLKNL